MPSRIELEFGLIVIVLTAVNAEVKAKSNEKSSKALEQKANKRKLESCLTLVRSLYSKEEVSTYFHSN
jgi:hypothetical protein